MKKEESQKLYDTMTLARNIVDISNLEQCVAQILKSEPDANIFFEIKDTENVIPYIKELVEEQRNKERKPKRHIDNLPVKQLISWFVGREKGKRDIASRQLKHRFMFLDYSDQITVMELFLNESMGYRKWCYKRLMEWKEPKFSGKVCELWEKYHEIDCARLMVEYLPTSIIRKYMDSFIEYMDKQGDPTFYIRLCRLFGREDWFDIDVDRVWDISKNSGNSSYYLWTLANSNIKPSKEKCVSLLYDNIIKEMNDSSIVDYIHFHERSIFDYEDFTMCPCILGKEQYFYLYSIMKMGYYDILQGLSDFCFDMNKLINKELLEIAHVSEYDVKQLIGNKGELERLKYVKYGRFIEKFKEQAPLGLDDIWKYKSHDREVHEIKACVGIGKSKLKLPELISDKNPFIDIDSLHKELNAPF